MGQLKLAEEYNGMLPTAAIIKIQEFIAYIKASINPDLWDEVIGIVAEDFENECALDSPYGIGGGVFMANSQEKFDIIINKRPYKVSKQKEMNYVYSN